MNSGQPEQYSDFLTRCQEFVKAKVETAVDDRRHDQVDEDGQAITHLAMAMSARDLHEQVAKECTEGTAIPSVQWLRLQFWPNRASAAAHKKKLAESKLNLWLLRGNLKKNTLTVTTHQQSFATRRNFALSFEK